MNRPHVKIVSDGTTGGTMITVDGTELMNVTGITWSLDCAHGLARASLDLIDVEVEIEAEAEIQHRRLGRHDRP